MVLSKSATLCLAGILTIGCQPSSQDQRTAPQEISQSFTLSKNGQLAQDEQNRIGIAISSLNKEFLLQSSMMNQLPLAMSSGLKSRIVTFKQFANELLMLQSPDGHVINKDFPSRVILAKFPIVKRTQDHLYFDFNSGMSQIFVNGDWYSAAAGEADYFETFSAVPVNVSYLEDVRFVNNQMVIRQLAQVAGESQPSTVEVKYYLEPYRTNPEFITTAPANNRQMGFFTTAARYDSTTGETEAFATKFDHQQEIVFGISSNTPAEYRDAVREGILYWNRAFANEPIKAVMAPEGVTAPDYNLNMVQWVQWDDAGFAYADAQSDPRTGEIRHAQIFMTSVFAVSGKKRAERLLKKLDHGPTVKPQIIGLKGMLQAPLCNRSQATHFRQFLQNAVTNDLDDAAILEVSKDYVREVIAHEVGHTLGLRHNFAGSLHQNYSPWERETLFRQYLQTGRAPQGVVPASSVMEYQPFEEASLTGDIIEKGFAALDYDLKVIQALYDNKEFNITELPAFCSDGRGYADCQTFDIGRDPLESVAWYRDANANLLVDALVSEILLAKSETRAPNLNSDYWSSRYFANTVPIFHLFSDSFRLLSVRRFYETINEYNISAVRQEEKAVIEERLSQLPGSTNLIDWLPAAGYIDYDQLMTSFIDAIETEDQLIDAEKGQARQAVRQLLAKMPAKTLMQEMQFLQAPATLADRSWSDQFLEYLEERVREVVLAENGVVTAQIVQADSQVTEITLPEFRHSLDIRLAALSALKQDRGYKPWLIKAMKERMTTSLQAIEAASFGDNKPKNYQDLDATAGRWYNEYRAMINHLRRP